MGSTFGLLESARSGLNASQIGLSITTQNISNANTTGYTRQALNASAKSPDTGAYRYANSINKVGQGVSIDSIYQIRDSFLDVRYRYENSDYNLYNTTNSLLSPIEDQFEEVADSTTSTNKLVGLSGMIDNIISSLNSGETTPTDTSISADVESKVDYLVQSIRNDSKYLDDALDSANKELSIYVNGGVGDTSTGDTSGGVNGIITDIQSLNHEIVSYEVTGQKANDLRDQRNVLLDKLSNYIDIDSEEQENGMVTVKLQNDSSKSIIDSDNNATIFNIGTDSTSGAKVLQWGDTINPDGVHTSPTSTKTAVVEGGTVKAYLNVINGDASGTSDATTGQCGNLGIPYLKKKLNEFAVAFVNVMNNAGNVVNSSDVSGTQFITYDGYSSSKSTADMLKDDVASSISVTTSWKEDTSLFLSNYTGASSGAGSYYENYEAALTTTTGTVPTPTSSDSSKMYSNSVRDFADSFTVEIGSAVNSASNSSSSAKTNAENLDEQRQSISSVSTNDEGVNIIKYQQAYNANARVITAIDEMLDKLINGTGTVGLS